MAGGQRGHSGAFRRGLGRAYASRPLLGMRPLRFSRRKVVLVVVYCDGDASGRAVDRIKLTSNDYDGMVIDYD